MDILITAEYTENDRHYLELETEKRSASISWHAELGMINILCKNASHRAYMGFGRTVWSWEEAKAAYKSAAMRAMIELAEQRANGNEVPA